MHAVSAFQAGATVLLAARRSRPDAPIQFQAAAQSLLILVLKGDIEGPTAGSRYPAENRPRRSWSNRPQRAAATPNFPPRTGITTGTPGAEKRKLKPHRRGGMPDSTGIQQRHRLRTARRTAAVHRPAPTSAIDRPGSDFQQKVTRGWPIPGWRDTAGGGQWQPRLRLRVGT